MKNIYHFASKLDVQLCQRAKSRFQSNTSNLFIQHLQLSHCDIRIHIEGEGPPLVMLPDPPNTIEHHAQLINKLKSHFRVICFELPGFGFSYPKSTMRYDLQGLTDVFEELFNKLNLHQLYCFLGLK